MTYPRRYLLGIVLFNQGDFFEAHEVWEHLWQESARPERDFYQGLIQSAVALCHHYNGNGVVAERLHERAAGRLRRYQPRFGGLDVSGFLARLERWLKTDPGTLGRETPPRIDLDPPPALWPSAATE